jgi:rod shape-determining protein MreC
MESVFGRYRNLVILVIALFVQGIALGVQVRRPSDTGPTRLIRLWVVSAVTPLEKAIVWAQSSTAGVWRDYFYLRGVRQENRDLKAEIQRLRLQQVRLSQDAEQARRLQALLGFKEQTIVKTLAAQVIGSSGSEQSRSVFIDKGSNDGVKSGMAVITADGIIGRTLHVFGSTSEVLLINDQTSGVGALLEKSRLQGVLCGTPSGEVILEKVMSDERVQTGERVVTSGGDQIFPKGLPVGVVTQVSPGRELFLNIRVKPAADLSRLEEVLVVTQVQNQAPAADSASNVRAVDILAERLPSVPDKTPDAKAPGAPQAAVTAAGQTPAAASQKTNDAGTKAPSQGLTQAKPRSGGQAAETSVQTGEASGLVKKQGSASKASATASPAHGMSPVAGSTVSQSGSTAKPAVKTGPPTAKGSGLNGTPGGAKAASDKPPLSPPASPAEAEPPPQ